MIKAPPRICIGIDPGQTGAICALTGSPDNFVAVFRYAHGSEGYYEGSELSVNNACAALRALVIRTLDAVGFRGVAYPIVRIERLGRRPGESLRSSATAERSEKAWGEALDGLFPDAWGREVTATIDRCAGLPRIRKGRAGRKLDALEFARHKLGDNARLLIPPGCRSESDGAADAFVIAWSIFCPPKMGRGR